MVVKADLRFEQMTPNEVLTKIRAEFRHIDKGMDIYGSEAQFYDDKLVIRDVTCMTHNILGKCVYEHHWRYRDIKSFLYYEEVTLYGRMPRLLVSQVENKTDATSQGGFKITTDGGHSNSFCAGKKEDALRRAVMIRAYIDMAKKGELADIEEGPPNPPELRMPENKLYFMKSINVPSTACNNTGHSTFFVLLN